MNIPKDLGEEFFFPRIFWKCYFVANRADILIIQDNAFLQISVWKLSQSLAALIAHAARERQHTGRLSGHLKAKHS